MFEVGKSLREARIDAGVSIEEAAKDINIADVVLTNIEEGAIGSFKDIFDLKEYIIIYSRYLGLESDPLIDLFNEYLFEYTSKIPVKDIERQVNEQNKDKQSKIVSPYTNPIKKPSKYYIVIYTVIITLVILTLAWSVSRVILGG